MGARRLKLVVALALSDTIGVDSEPWNAVKGPGLIVQSQTGAVQRGSYRQQCEIEMIRFGQKI